MKYKLIKYGKEQTIDDLEELIEQETDNGYEPVSITCTGLYGQRLIILYKKIVV